MIRLIKQLQDEINRTTDFVRAEREQREVEKERERREAEKEHQQKITGNNRG